MNTVVIAILIGVIASALVASFVLGENWKHKVNRNFFLLAFCIILWGTGILLRYTAVDINGAYIGFGIAIFFSVGTVFGFFRFTRVFLEDVFYETARFKYLLYIERILTVTAIVLFLIQISPIGIDGFRNTDGHFRANFNRFYIVFLCWAILTVVSSSIICFLYSRKTNDRIRRKQMLLVALSPLTPVLFYCLTEIVNFTTGFSVDREPYSIVAMFSVVIAYGIIKFDLMRLSPERAARKLIESLPDGLVLLSRDGIIHMANHAFLSLLGRDAQKVLGKHIWSFFYVPEFSDIQLNAIDFTQTERRDLALEMNSASGAPIPIHATLQPIGPKGSDRIGVIALLRDLSETKRLEAELIQSEKLSGLGQLAAGIGHEINNPLTVISGHVDLLEKALNQNQPDIERMKVYTSRQKTAVTRISLIINGLRRVARSSDNCGALVDANKTIEDVVSLIAPIYKNDHVIIETVLEAKHAIFKGNYSYLNQIIMNLLANAFDALKSINVERKIVINTTNDDTKVIISITDNGHGIDKVRIPKVFDTFFTTKEIGQGTGLGLSIVKSQVENMAGVIEVNSESGSGSTFTLRFPIGHEPQVRTEKTKPPRLTGKVLVVDDEKEIRDLIAQSLINAGMQVTCAENGETALGLYLEHHYDYVLTDLKMPKKGGVQLIRDIRECGKGNPKIIVITGVIHPHNRDEFSTLNVDGIIEKPFLEKQLHALLFKTAQL